MGVRDAQFITRDKEIRRRENGRRDQKTFRKKVEEARGMIR